MVEILTQRFKLREIHVSDVLTMVNLFVHEEVRKHFGGVLEEIVVKEKAEKLVGKHGYFLITKKENGEILGLCYLDRYRTGDLEVSFEFFPQFWGQGFGKEAVSAVIAWGFDNMDVDHIIAVTQKANENSRKLLESLGMVIKDEFEEFDKPQVLYIIKR